ncbi:MAG: hypothetical protein LBP42_05500 [Treponema sp.]|jgi:bacteriorhodopsin|nr:hypothetical protein [Treponema sp.]
MTELFEALMIFSFGLSWPTSIIKSWKAGTAKGKSIVFLGLILFGYLCGIAGKLITGKITYVFVFYVINFVMVGVDMVLYFRNRREDRKTAG